MERNVFIAQHGQLFKKLAFQAPQGFWNSHKLNPAVWREHGNSKWCPCPRREVVGERREGGGRGEGGGEKGEGATAARGA